MRELSKKFICESSFQFFQEVIIKETWRLQDYFNCSVPKNAYCEDYLERLLIKWTINFSRKGIKMHEKRRVDKFNLFLELCIEFQIWESTAQFTVPYCRFWWWGNDVDSPNPFSIKTEIFTVWLSYKNLHATWHKQSHRCCIFIKASTSKPLKFSTQLSIS